MRARSLLVVPAAGTALAIVLLQMQHDATPPRSRPHVSTSPSSSLAVSPSAARSKLPLSFVSNAYTPRPLAPIQLPYNGSRLVPLSDTGIHDAAGVRMVRRQGTLYNHPVAQSQYGLDNLNTYRVTKDRRYLDRAAKQAQRLVDRRREVGAAWFFPYPFDFALHGKANAVLKGPWYSAMAQGQALSLFTRLYEATGQRRWRDAADAAFGSFLLPPSRSQPWVVHVDSSRYLWLDEYPHTLSATSDLTFNGHNFSTFGLYDYAMMSHDREALRLLAGAETTSRHYAPTFREKGWISRYCLEHPSVRSDKYHLIHTSQLLQLYSMTGDPGFAAAADAFRDDFPDPHVGGIVRLPAGPVTGFRFDPNGHVTDSRSITLTPAGTASADSRSRIQGKGVYDRLTSGDLAGFWVRDGDGGAAMSGILLTHIYSPDRRITVGAGRVTAYGFDAAGNVTGTRTVTFARASSTTTGRTSLIGGRTYALVAAGPFAGSWLLVADVTMDR